MNNQLKTPSQLVESSEFLAWCGKWFGGDSDEEYLARAVAGLYLPAILAAPQPEQAEPEGYVWDGKVSDRLQKGLSDLALQCPYELAVAISHLIREEFNAIYTSYGTVKRMYRAAQDRLDAIDAAAPQPAEPKQDYLDTPIDWDLNGVPYTREQAILDHCGPLALAYIKHAILYYTKD